jgi:hypothetical protein
MTAVETPHAYKRRRGIMTVKRAIYQGKERGIQDAVHCWKADHDNAMAACEVEDLVNECLGARDILRQWLEASIKRALAGTIRDFDNAGYDLRDALETGLRRIKSVRECVERVERLGYTVENSDELDRADREITEMHDRLMREWPFATVDVVNQSITDYKEGRYRSAMEIFDELQCPSGKGC